MGYVPEWESLAETLARVMACGYSVSDAQRDICHALRDGKLRRRYRVGRVQTPDGFDVNLRAVGQLRSPLDQRDIIGRPRVPPDLIPDDIDWVNSRPKCPWLDQHRFLVRIDKIEVSTKDVIRTLCVGPSGVSSTGPSDLSSRETFEASLVNEAAADPGVEAAAEPSVEAAAQPSVEAAAEPPPIETVAEPVVEAVAEPAVEARAKKRLTAGEETRAAIALGQELEQKPQISRATAKQFLSDMGLVLDGRPFQRVWVNARVRAGQPIRARAGRKRKSPRQN
jgi:hypothetical protein